MTGPQPPGRSDNTTAHPSIDLDDVVHQRARLGILAVLMEVRDAEFTYLRRLLEVTDGNLGRHLEVLEREGLINIVKGFEGRRPKTRVHITVAGRRALSAEMDALRELVRRFDAADDQA